MAGSPMLSFEKFMARALHDPKTGYYARRITGVGRRGDFTTAPTLSQAPARAIAAWAAKALKETGTRHLIEIGPGEGVLAAAVLKHLPLFLRWRVRLHLIETSGPLAEIQRRNLGSGVLWHRTPAEALAAAGGRAVIWSNELVDAFPVRRFENTPGGWQEIGVSFDPLAEILIPASDLPLSSSFSTNHPVGQRIEVHESYQRWLADWIPFWKAGRMLTIDYGSTADRLYHRRPKGTVRSYLFHQRGEGLAVYENPGRQDITADVNFTDLIDRSSAWCSEHRLLTFGDFVKPHANPEIEADCYLTAEEGPGGTFLVLDQKRS